MEWRCVAIDHPDPHEHAAALQMALTTLTDEGFNVTNMQPRGSALIITASRMITPEPTETVNSTGSMKN